MKGFFGRSLRLCRGAALVTAALACGSASAGWYNDGKVFLTGGVFTVDGAGGGGAVPWATITGYETRDGINGGLGFTYVSLPNYDLNIFGGAVGFFDRFELSYSNTKLSTDLPIVDLVGLLDDLLLDDLLLGTGLDSWNSQLHMQTFGAKLRLFGDAVYTSDSWIPQTAIGYLYKVNDTPEFIHTLGANKDKDYEIYLAMTKVLFPISTLVNVTARYTSANQIGLTGFGECSVGGCTNDKELRWEVSIAHLLNKQFAIGAEWQQHGDNLDGKSVTLANLPLGPVLDLVEPILPGLNEVLEQEKESDWFDFFFAYAPSKNYSITIAYLMLGNIAVASDQNGLYMSLHATF